MHTYSIATLADGTDVLVPSSTGSPGSDFGPDEVVYLDDSGRIVFERDESGPGWPEEDVMQDPEPRPRPIGPRMAEALEFIASHPGCCKADVFRGTGVRRSANGTDPMDRLLRRRMIYDLGPSHRYALYAWQEPENNNRPAGMWVPGHP
jgi:hypothetical protein